jgi:hypothetical protein
VQQTHQAPPPAPPPLVPAATSSSASGENAQQQDDQAVFVCLFVCLFVCFFVCLFVCLFVCQDIDEWETGNEWYKRVLQSTGQAYCCLCWTARLFVCLFVCLFVYLCVFVCLYCNLSGAAGVGTTLRALGTYSGEAKTIACQRMPQSACTASA